MSQVERIHRHDVVSVSEQRQQCCAHGCHTRRCCECGFPAFQGGNFVFEHRLGRISPSCIDIARIFVRERSDALLRCLKLKGAVLVDGRDEGTCFGEGFFAGVDGFG